MRITPSETKSKRISVAASFGWDVSQFRLVELLSDEGLDLRSEQTVLQRAEAELVDLQLHSIANRLIDFCGMLHDYGGNRCWLRVAKGVRCV